MALSLRADPGPMTIWFTAPGTPGNTTSWQQEGLPVGNGKLAAMVYGGVGSEQLQFNEDTIWGGQPHDYSHPNGASFLPQLQTYIFATNQSAFWSSAQVNWMSVPLREAAYQPPGALVLTFPHSGTSNYRRSLALDSATVNVHYDFNGVTYNRDIFASAPSNKVIVIRFTASQSARIAFTCSFTTPQTATFSASGNDLIMHGSVSAIADSRYYATGLTNGVKFDARVRLLATGGTVTAGGSSISVTNADDVTLLLAVASNVVNYNDLSADYALICSNNIAAAAALGYSPLRQAQQNDYQNLYNRVVLDLGGNSKTNQGTGYRKKQIGIDGDDPQLIALAFQLGRYLMISGSRPGAQALNLQGKWNDATVPDWDSKMTLNINEEMNYWGAEVCNLSECTLPLFDMIQDLSVTGNRVAKTNYNSDGWVAHHNTDLWRGAAPINGQDGVWPTGGAWLCQHLWWHYLYTGDTNWLATTGYPLMKGAAQFFQGSLVTHPKYGYKVTNPSYSPEHDELNYGSNVPGPTMDNDLIRDLFNHVIDASTILGVDDTFRTNIINLRSQLPPDKIGSGGQLQEWLEDVDGGGYDAGHRHCSHLVGFFPGDDISSFYKPITAAGAKVSVDLRGYGNSSLTPWSIAWRINLRTRLQDGEGAFRNLTNLLAYSKLSTNLIFADGHRQLDATFGMLSGIAEMFMQSQAGEVFLLPALPSKLTNGTVSGLCARGGFEVGIAWTNSKLSSATILSKVGNTCRVRSHWPIDVMLGTNYVDAPMILPGLYQFTTIIGSNYTILPALVAETESLAATTSGATQQTITNAAYSNLRGTRLNAGAPANSVTYTVSNIVAGTYRIRVAADAGPNCARFQLTGGPSGGALTNLGPVQDAYSPTNLAYLLPIKITTTTNVISLWTNLIREFDCGTWTAPSNGNYDFKFTVVDKNASSSGYTLAFDNIKFTPAPSAPAPPNQPPTDVTLSSSSVAENQPAGTAIGNLTTTDPDAGNTFTYALVSGVGDTNNALFAVSGNVLQTAAAFDFESQTNYSVRIRSTDQGGLSVEKAFSIAVLDTNEAPTDILLSNTSVLENQPTGTVVGLLSSADPDAGDTFTYNLVPGTGSESNSFFTVSGQQLQIVGPLDGDAANTSLNIRLRSTDAGGMFFEKTFVISVLNTNEPPFTPVNLTPAEGAANQLIPVTLQTSPFSDPDNGDSQAAGQWLVRRASDSVVIFDSGEDTVHKTSLIVPSGALEFLTTYNWQARHEDSHGFWSGYSTPTAFSTGAPVLTATVQDGMLVLSWPTNATGFFLQSASNPAPENWNPASPPTIVGDLNVVTNRMDGDRMFYRLNRP